MFPSEGNQDFPEQQRGMAQAELLVLGQPEPDHLVTVESPDSCVLVLSSFRMGLKASLPSHPFVSPSQAGLHLAPLLAAVHQTGPGAAPTAKREQEGAEDLPYSAGVERSSEKPRSCFGETARLSPWLRGRLGDSL